MQTENIENFTIGDLARLACVNVETVRFYQRRGLLIEPERAAGKIRRYGAADATRIQFIKSAQILGFTLDEVMTLLTLEDGTQCHDASQIAQQKIREIRNKIAGLRRMEKTLSKLVGECEKGDGKICCPLISSLQAS